MNEQHGAIYIFNSILLYPVTIQTNVTTFSKV